LTLDRAISMAELPVFYWKFSLVDRAAKRSNSRHFATLPIESPLN